MGTNVFINTTAPLYTKLERRVMADPLLKTARALLPRSQLINPARAYSYDCESESALLHRPA